MELGNKRIKGISDDGKFEIFLKLPWEFPLVGAPRPVPLFFIKPEYLRRIFAAVYLIVPLGSVFQTDAAKRPFDAVAAGFGDVDKNALVLVRDHGCCTE